MLLLGFQRTSLSVKKINQTLCVLSITDYIKDIIIPVFLTLATYQISGVSV